jgi:phosphatidylethanolamine/phosphatidyl-N-methylethanolamine N-methyltransferase
MDNEDQAWIDYRDIFSKVYDEANYASALQSRVMHASHKLIEKHHGSSVHFSRVLEVGAGTGEHFPFVRHGFDEYILSDMDAQALEVARKKLGDQSNHPGRVIFTKTQGQSLSYPDASFDRLIAVHVLEHIVQPHLAIKEWMRVLKPGGLLSVLIPSDPGIAWRLGRHLGPRRQALSQGIAYDYVMAREHVNASTNLIALLRYYLPEARESWWPVPIPSVDLNLFFAYEAMMTSGN